MAAAKDLSGGHDGKPVSFFRLTRDDCFSCLSLLVLLGLAILTRLPSFDGRALWNDELWRALTALDPQYLHAYFFAPGVKSALTSPAYALFMKLTSAVYVSPATLRLTSFLPGIFAPLVAFAAIR